MAPPAVACCQTGCTRLYRPHAECLDAFDDLVLILQLCQQGSSELAAMLQTFDAALFLALPRLVWLWFLTASDH